jgi:hypothetical protein
MVVIAELAHGVKIDVHLWSRSESHVDWDAVTTLASE